MIRASFQLPALVILAFIAGSTAGFLGSSLTETKHYDGSDLRQERDDLRDRLQEEEARKKRLESELALGGILRPVSESKALIVRVFRTQFLQIYIFEKQGIIIGNFYDELPDGRVEHLGRFKLRR